MDENKEPMAPVQAVVIGGTGTGTGSGSTMDGSAEHTLTTPNGRPNIQALVISPLMAIAISALAAFFASFTSNVTTGGLTDIIQFHGFVDLMEKSAVLALGSAAVDGLKNLTTLFTRLRDKFPWAQI